MIITSTIILGFSGDFRENSQMLFFRKFPKKFRNNYGSENHSEPEAEGPRDRDIGHLATRRRINHLRLLYRIIRQQEIY